MSPFTVVCPHCHQTNRLPYKEQYKKAVCGHCKGSLLDTAPADLDPSAFEKHLNNSDLPVVVDFWAPWCGPCRMMAPAFKEAAAALPLKAQFVKVNTETYPALSTNFGIRGIPTIIIFKGGQEVQRSSGALSAQQILQMVQQVL